MNARTAAALEAVIERLDRLESEQAIRRCMQRYMTLCDELDECTPLDELAGLFCEDAVWEGIGERYQATFGRLEGRAAIRAMLGKYCVAPAHFRLNAHFLTSEQISVIGDGEAVGHWLMLQTSTFADERSHLTAARLTVDFARGEAGWQIRHFRTENLFGRPVAAWDQADPLPVPR